MSGGAMNYLYSRIESDGIENIEQSTPERKAFVSHLRDVAKALHDIEWVDSGDFSPGDEVESIMKVIRPVDVISQIISEGKELHEALSIWLNTEVD